MSIKSHLLAMEAKGVLRRFTAPAPHASVRALFFMPEIEKEIANPNSAVNFYKARHNCERALEKWVLGEPVKMKMSGSGTGSDIARLDAPPTNVWEIRVVEPRPQFRWFCQFACQDTIIVASLWNRDTLGERFRKSGKRNDAWQAAMNDTLTKVSKIMGPFSPLVSEDPSDFVSSNKHVL